jgi:hypothetical protein
LQNQICKVVHIRIYYDYFSSVCVRLCVLKWSDLEKNLPH